MAKPSPAVLSVRVSPAERQLLEAAAQQAHTNLSDFIRRKAVEAAELDVLGQRIITIPSDAWLQVEGWVNASAKEIPALRTLSTARPAWQD